MMWVVLLVSCRSPSEEPVYYHLVAPMLQVAPVRPTTDQEVVAEVLKQETELALGDVETNYEWRSGDKVWESAILPSEWTALGEEWTVEAWFESEGVTSNRAVDTVEIIDTPTQITLDVFPKPPSTLDDVIVSVDVVDPDEQVNEISYRWSKNSSPVDWSQGVLPSEMTSRGDLWQVYVVAENEVQTSLSDLYSFEIANTPPAVQGLSIYPLAPSRDEFLQLNILAEDLDQDELSYEYRWYVNEALVTNQHSNRIYTGQFSQQDSIVAEVRAFDGDDVSGWKRSYPVQVQNSVPEIVNLSITPENPTSEQILYCAYEHFSDSDNDADQSSIVWIRDGSVLGNGAYLDLRPIVMQGYDRISCVATASDGFEEGNTLTATVDVENSAPVTYAVSVTPTTAYETSQLSCSPGTTTDIDGNTTFSYDYTWFVNGVDLGLPTSTFLITGMYFSKNDSVMCGVTPFDGISYGSMTQSNVVSIQNSAPTASNIVISPSNPQFTSTLTCMTSNYADADSDTNQSIFLWKKNGQLLQYGQSINLAQVQATRTDVFTCEVTLFDGQDFGAQFSADASIGNILPEVSSVELSPSNPTSDEVIESTVVYSDADGDLVSLEYDWYINGASSGETGDSISGLYGPGDEIELLVTPYDGYEYGLVQSSDVLTIVNTPPTEPTVDLVEDSTGLQCVETVSSTDADNDPIVMNLRWWCDGQELPIPTGPYDPALMNSFSSTVYTHDTVPPSLYGSCVLWICGMTPNDGYDNGPEGTSGVHIIGL